MLQIWCATAATAQLNLRNGRLSIRDELKTEQVKRKGLKEAKNYDSAYKDTHLNTQTYGYKNGREGRKAQKRDAANNRQQKDRKVKKGIKHKGSLFRQTRGK